MGPGMFWDPMRPKRHLEYYSRVYPSAWKHVDKLRAERGKTLPLWPEWCFIPLAGAYAIVSGEAESQGINVANPDGRPLVNDVGIIGALAAWRVTQGVYRFDPDVYQAVIDTPISGDLPHTVLFALPEWCIYIETPELKAHGVPVVGFFAYLEYDAGDTRKELRLVLDCDGESPGLLSVPMHLGPWPLRESLDRMIEEARRQSETSGIEFPPGLAEHMEAGHAPLLSLLLYICAVNGEIGGGDKRPVKPRAKKTKKGPRMFPAQRVTVWDVGVRMGAALRAATRASSQSEPAEQHRSGPRPHVRRAHWHGYWTGPHDGERKFLLKWLSPILVGGDAGDMPVTIRPVE